MKRLLFIICVLALPILGGRIMPTAASTSAAAPVSAAAAVTARTQPLIVDHTTADITLIPQVWIEAAKNSLNIYYGHTSHGSQLVSGMDGLVAFANGGGLGLSLPQDIFDGLSVQETSPDLGYYPEWVNNTLNYLGAPDPATGRGTAHPNINVVIWSWCGQVSDISEQDLINHYLSPMSQLELNYPGITFVYMTGHADGTGETGNLHLRNDQIRQYVIDNNKVLFDFYDFDIHDPDGTYYGDKAVTDELWYDSDGNGSRDKNWGTDWQNSHNLGSDWYSVDCAHSESINCNQKAYGSWWLWASLAGWNAPAADPDLSSSSKTAGQTAVQVGDTVTYTVQIINATGELTNTVQLTDTLPAGLTYKPGSLWASSGVADDSNAPTLAWSGILTPSTITITYAATVATAAPQAITNTATINAPGYTPITRSATVIANGDQVYLPLIQR